MSTVAKLFLVLLAGVGVFLAPCAYDGDPRDGAAGWLAAIDQPHQLAIDRVVAGGREFGVFR